MIVSPVSDHPLARAQSNAEAAKDAKKIVYFSAAFAAFAFYGVGYPDMLLAPIAITYKTLCRPKCGAPSLHGCCGGSDRSAFPHQDDRAGDEHESDDE